MASGSLERKIDVDPSSLALWMLVKGQGREIDDTDSETAKRYASLGTNSTAGAGCAVRGKQYNN